MKQFILAIALMAGLPFFAQAQSKEMNTAKNHFDQYINYEKAENKTESLDKAKLSIDAALENIKTKQAAGEVVKDNIVGKAQHYKALIYTELATTSKTTDKVILDASLNAIEQSVKLDPKGQYKLEDLNCIQRIYGTVYNAGIAAFNGKQYESALGLFEKSLLANDIMNKVMQGTQIDTASVLMAAYSAQNANKTDVAIKYYEEAVKKEFKDESVYTNLSNIYMAQNNGQRANEVIAVGKKLYPNSNNFLLNEINYLLKENRQKEAIGKMEDAAKLYPDNASLFVVLGNTYETFKTDEMNAKAEAAYKRAIEVDPKYFDALYNLAAFYYNKAADIISVANQLGTSAADTKKYDELKKKADDMFKIALPYFERCVAINPKDIGTLTAMKGIYATMGDIAKSSEYKKMIEALGGK